MRFCYADPPYLGAAKKHYGKLHTEACIYDTVQGHAELISALVDEYPDGWALSLSSPSLQTLLALCPSDVRVMSWVKPFASFKPGVGVAYAWEPVIVRGGRKRTREQDTVRDWVSANITMERGFPGAKPRAFAIWIMDVLNVQKGDELIDLFPGSRAMQAAFDERLSEDAAQLTLTG